MKKTLIILGVAVLALIALLLKNRHDVKATQADALALDSAGWRDVKKITVAKGHDTATLQNQDGKWAVQPGGYPADTAKVAKVLKSVFSLQDREMVSRSPDRYSEYGLDSAESKSITCYAADGKPKAQVVVGKTAGTDYNSTYWRWQSRPDVYRTPGNFAWEIGPKPDDWKDRKLFAVDAKAVKELDVAWKDTTGAAHAFQAAQDSGKWKLSQPAPGAAKKDPLEQMAGRFNELSVDEFSNPKDTNLAKADTANPTLDVTAKLNDGASKRLVATKPVGGYAYVRHPDRPEWVKLSSWRLDVFKKKPEDVAEAPKPDSAAAKRDSAKATAPQAAKPAAPAPPATKK